MSRLQEEMLQAQVDQERAKAKALSGPAPMKLHPGGAGYTSAFYQMDPQYDGCSEGAVLAAELPVCGWWILGWWRRRWIVYFSGECCTSKECRAVFGGADTQGEWSK